MNFLKELFPISCYSAVLPTARVLNFWPRRIWAEFLAEFLIFPNIGRKQPELSKFSFNIHNFHFRLTKSVKFELIFD